MVVEERCIAVTGTYTPSSSIYCNCVITGARMSGTGPNCLQFRTNLGCNITFNTNNTTKSLRILHLVFGPL